MTATELAGELDHARILLTAVERLVGDKDAEATMLVIDLRGRLTRLVEAVEDGEIEH